MTPSKPPEAGTPSADPRLQEVEAVARIGSYSIDLVAGRWVSSQGLDAIFGIDPTFDRSVDGWASLIHPADREGMVAYLTEEVIRRGRPFDRQYRILRADTGAERWVHGRGRLEFDASGRPVGMFGTIADITDGRSAQVALARSERLYGAIFEGTIEAILISEQVSLCFRYANAAASALLGYTRDKLLGLTVRDILPPEVLPEVLGQFETLRAGGGVARAVPCLCGDGTVILADIKTSPLEIDGVPCLVGFFSDVTERTLAEEALRLSERNLGEAQRLAHIGSWEWDLATDTALRSDELHRIYGVEPGTIARTAEAFLEFVHPDDRARVHAVERAAVTGRARYVLDYRSVRPDGGIRFVHDEAEVVCDPNGTPVRMVGIVQDVTERVAAEADRARLVSAIEQSSDSVVIADLAGTIGYVNPAFERVSGYSRDEAIGQNPRMLKSGRQSAGFYRALWRRLTRGQSWTGTLVNRRKDGALYEVEATLSPIRGPDGEVAGYVGVERDVTAVRAAESTLAAEFRERAQVAAALARLQPSPTADETAAAICGELLALPGIDLAAIFDFREPGRAITLASGGPDGVPFGPGKPLPAARASYLFERALQGPWAETWRARPEDGSYGLAIEQLGNKASAFAPIQNGDGLLGLIAVGTLDEAYAGHLVNHLPVVSEFAATASALLSPELEQSHRSDVVKERIGRVLSERRFSPVFQPIIALDTREPVGYEALTRFADRTSPDRVIAQAHAVGLGRDLELALIRAALKASKSLPRDCWLSLNVSPGVILNANERLSELISGRSGRIVLEVTEHVEIDDYRAIREAISNLGPTVSLAVDDAGAGFASLRHVVELRPQFLKLDISLVRDVDRDLTRQAMIAGLTQFAQRVRCEVIAEGIEQQAELVMLRELGVPLGQGYLLGRPHSLAVASGSARLTIDPMSS